MNFICYYILFFLQNGISQELIVGREKIEPGIIIIFEGAIKDQISPVSLNLDINHTDVHLEARINWDTLNIPKGAPIGGFIPYLKILSKIINQKTGVEMVVELIPHISLKDNLHYARNVSLPGEIDDLYRVEFEILPPSELELSYHKDWLNKYGSNLILQKTFSYNNINFNEIAKASR